MLNRTAGFGEVLLNFAHFEDKERITLQENAHFFLGTRTSVNPNSGEFDVFQIKHVELRPDATIYIRVDQLGNVFLETGRGTRIFRNIFTSKAVMTFKGLSNVPFFLYVAFNMLGSQMFTVYSRKHQQLENLSEACHTCVIARVPLCTIFLS